MKKMMILVLLFCSYVLQAQELQLKFIATNSYQVSSTVVIGRDNSASEGLDESFNEENIYSSEIDLVDLRSIQRTEDLHECLNSSPWDNTGNPLYFENNVDLKTDIRSMDFTDSKNSCFELKMIAQDYPVKLTIDASNWYAGSMHFFWIGLFDKNCNKVGQIDLFNGEMTNYDIQEENAIDRIIVKLNHEVSVNESKLNLFKIIPNPISTNGIIRLSNNSNGNLEIFNIEGIEVFNSRNQNEIIISTSMLKSGLYIVKCSDRQGKVEIKKLIIQ